MTIFTSFRSKKIIIIPMQGVANHQARPPRSGQQTNHRSLPMTDSTLRDMSFVIESLEQDLLAVTKELDSPRTKDARRIDLIENKASLEQRLEHARQQQAGGQ